MRVIFLDIDGVLNCEATDVVLTSSWRCDPIGVLAARHYGLPFHELAADKEGCKRGNEIGEWLRSHPKAGRFVVIDDENDGLDDLPLFQPSPKTGLTAAMADAISTIWREHRPDPTPALMRLVKMRPPCLPAQQAEV